MVGDKRLPLIRTRLIDDNTSAGYRIWVNDTGKVTRHIADGPFIEYFSGDKTTKGNTEGDIRFYAAGHKLASKNIQVLIKFMW